MYQLTYKNGIPPSPLINNNGLYYVSAFDAKQKSLYWLKLFN